MKIISKFKDYYDGIQSLGIDKSLVYRRLKEIKEVELPEGYTTSIKNSTNTLEWDTILLVNDYKRYEELRIKCEQVLIGFCGKLVPAIRFNYNKKGITKNSVVLYNAQTIIEYFNKLKRKYKELHFTNSLYGYPYEEPDQKTLNTFFKQRIFEQNYHQWFQNFGAPVFIFSKEIIRKFEGTRKRNGLYVALNPSLKALEFYRVKDSYSAFQEIAQYLGGVLTKRESIENKLSDIDKIKQHGFDVKYGFRTRKKEK